MSCGTMAGLEDHSRCCQQGSLHRPTACTEGTKCTYMAEATHRSSNVDRQRMVRVRHSCLGGSDNGGCGQQHRSRHDDEGCRR